MTKRAAIQWRVVGVAFLMQLLMLPGCGGGGGGGGRGGNTPTTYTVGGMITGHTDTVVLQNNSGDNLTLPVGVANFEFDIALATGAAYSVTVLVQPAGQTCTVMNGSGTISAANVTDVAVNCPAIPTYAIGGSVSGLTGALVLQNNGGDDLTLSSNGSFAFATALANTAAYNVTVVTQPAGQTCTVTSGSGAVAGANVTSVAVSCTTNPVPVFTIGGAISGLTGTVVLQNNGSDTLVRTSNGAYAFATSLANGVAYSVTVLTQPHGQTCSVTNPSGNVPGANVTNVAINCVTNGKSWRTAALIETNNLGSALFPQIAFDASGNAIAVWSQSDGVRYNIWANRYATGLGWGTPELIETDNTGSAVSPQLAIDTHTGNALVVWQQFDGARYNIWANRYIAGSGWGTAALIEVDDSGEAIFPHIAMDADGNAIAIWQHSDGTRYNIWTNRYVAGSGWGTPELIETDNYAQAASPRVAFDANGNAIAVWQQQVAASRYDIWANRYTAGNPGSWGTAVLLETNDLGSAVFPQIAFDASGNAMAVWHQSDGVRDNIWANRYVAGMGWGTATLIEADNLGNATSPRTAFDASGNAIVVWQQSDGVRDNIWAKRYTVGAPGSWGTAVLLETDNLGNAGYPQIAFDAGSGDALVVWHQSDSVRYNIWASRYVPGTGWDTAGLIETNNLGSALFPQIAVDASGNAIAVWSQSDGMRDNIWANRYE